MTDTPTQDLSRKRYAVLERFRIGQKIALSLPLANATNQAVTVFTGHSKVGQQHIGPLPDWRCSDQIISFGGGTGGDHVRSVLRKRLLKQFARIILIIDHQHAHAREFPRTFDCNRRGDGAYWKHNFESRALAFARARSLNRSAMQLDQVFDERQAEAEAAIPFGARCVGLSEAVKDIGQEIRADAFPRVAHCNANVWVYALKAHFDATSLRGELDRVGEQVPNHLLQAGGVTGNRTNFGGEISLNRYPFSIRRRLDRLNRFLNYRDRVHWSKIEPELATNDAGGVEQVFDQLLLRLPATLDDVHRMLDHMSVQPAAM